MQPASDPKLWSRACDRYCADLIRFGLDGSLPGVLRSQNSSLLLQQILSSINFITIGSR
jgi:hypothetical protein